MPASPATASRTTRPLGNIVNTTSAPDAASRALLHARAAGCASRKRSSACGAHVEALHAMAGLAEMPRHRHAHHAKADEADGERLGASAMLMRALVR